MFRRFFRDEGGYALVLTLLFMPVFVGVGLLVMDIGRGNNAQGDHQAAADALALAGARELDGGAGAINRAMQAMEEVTNNVSFLGVAGSAPIDLNYTAGSTTPFSVVFLRAIPGEDLGATTVPGDDNTVIDQAFVNQYATGNDALAKYVYVYSQAADLSTFFFNPLTQAAENVPVGASAVATLKTATCDLAPFFMCNPFPNVDTLKSEFNSGRLYGRLLKLSVHTGSSPAGAGNIGFLRIDGNGAGATAEALAGKPYDQCLELSSSVDTQPGTITPAWDGFNTRFDMYENKFGGVVSRTSGYLPAENVRKGYRIQGGNACNVRSPSQELSTPPTEAELKQYFGINPSTNAYTAGFTANAAPFVSDNAAYGSPSFIQRGSWNLFAPVAVETTPGGPTVTYPPYWQSAYNDTLTVDELKAISRHPNKDTASLTSLAQITALEASTGIPFVSRYDVYNHEIALQRASSLPAARAGGEQNLPQCHANAASAGQTVIDRRTMLVAVVDCAANNINGAEVNVPVDAYAKMFLVRPVDGISSKITLDMEIVDVASNSGLGSTDEFLKTESMLVR